MRLNLVARRFLAKLRSTTKYGRAHEQRPRQLRRLQLEHLEDRTLLASISSIQAYLADSGGNKLLSPRARGALVYPTVEFTTRDFPLLNPNLTAFVASFTLGGETRSSSWIGNGTFRVRVPWALPQGSVTLHVNLDSTGQLTTILGPNVATQTDLRVDPTARTFDSLWNNGVTTLATPLDGTANRDWSIVNYVDLNPNGNPTDFRGGSYTLNGHRGIDFTLANFAAMDKGVPVLAAAGGIVKSVEDGNADRNTDDCLHLPIGQQAPRANFITINHGNGWETTYLSVRKNSIVVAVGDFVKAGNVIALVGSSGCSSDPHLTFEVRHQGVVVETYLDPAHYWGTNAVPYAGDTPGVIDFGVSDRGGDLHNRPPDRTVFSTIQPRTPIFWAIVHGIPSATQLRVRWTRFDDPTNPRANGGGVGIFTSTPDISQGPLHRAAIQSSLPHTFDARTDLTLWRAELLSLPAGSVLATTDFDVSNAANDQDGQFQFNSDHYFVTQNGGSVTITVVRNATPNLGNITVDFATANVTGGAVAGVNYGATSGTLVFQPGELVKSFNVPIFNNPLSNTPFLVVNLTNPGPRTRFASLGSQSQALVRILKVVSHEPIWLEQGPAPVTNGGNPNVAATENIPNGSIAGAVSALAPHPTNADIVYAAAVNGGIWKTTNATDAAPNWIPLKTDQLQSLSIGDISLSPVDPNVLYAGAANVSSAIFRLETVNPATRDFFRDGELTTGLLRTTDGGITWTMLGQGTFRGQNIVKVLPTALDSGRRVLVAASNGVWLSTDSGANWTLVSGTGGLPAGAASDMVRDPSNNNRFYVAIPSSIPTNPVVFRTDNGGNTWVATQVLPKSTVAPILPTDPLTDARVRLAVGPVDVLAGGSGGVVYAATMGSQLMSVSRSINGGNNWAEMTNMNSAPLNPSIHSGGQASFHFSIVADPRNPKIVFIGGDRQPDPPNANTPNVNGCTRPSGNHYRGDASLPLPNTWTSLNCNGANRTSPHPDSRAMAFDAQGNILEADDGGIYRLLNPNGDQRTVRQWVSANGNIRPTEFYSIAYDSVNHTILGGAQDNGSPEQSVPNSSTWTDTTGGDGGTVAVANFGNQSIHYSSVSAFGFSREQKGFHRRTFDNAGNLLSDVAPQLRITGTANSDLFDVEGSLSSSGVGFRRFIQPYVLNNVTPHRMIIGTMFLYESMDDGDDLTSLGGLNGGMPSNPTGQVTGMAYGGFLNGIGNPDVLWVGTQDPTRGLLWHRSSGTGMPTPINAYNGSPVVSVQMDPADWRSAYVLDDQGRVWLVQNTGTGLSSTELTGNLTGLFTMADAPQARAGLPNLRSIEVVRSGARIAVLIGGAGGVYRALNPTDNTTMWSRFGSGLSNAIVNDLHFNAPDNVLVAGTLGRGAWTLFRATDALFPSVLVVNAAGANSIVRVVKDPVLPVTLDVFLNGILVSTVQPGAFQQIVVNGTPTGNDRIDIDDTFAGTSVIVNLGSGTSTVNISPTAHNLATIQGDVTINGGGGIGTANVDDTGDTVSRSGTLTPTRLTGLGMNGTVSYTGLTSLNITLGSVGNTFTINDINPVTVTTVNGGSSSNDSLTANFAADFNGRLLLLAFERSTIQVTRDFNGFLSDTLPGTLQQVTIGRSLTSTGGLVAGGIDNLSVGQDVAGSTQVLGNLGTATLGGAVSGNVTVAANLGNLNVGSDVSGTVQVGANAGNVTVNGSISLVFTVGANLGNLNVGGDLSGTLQVMANAGNVNAAINGSLSGKFIVGANLGNLTVGRDISGTLQVGANAGNVTVNGSIAGTVQVGNDFAILAVGGSVTSTGLVSVGNNLAAMTVGPNMFSPGHVMAGRLVVGNTLTDLLVADRILGFIVAAHIGRVRALGQR